MQERTRVSWVHDSPDSDAKSPWESSAGLPCTLLTFSERSGQTSAPEATADSCTHTSPGPWRARGLWPASRPSEQESDVLWDSQTDSSAPARGLGPDAPPASVSPTEAGLGPHSPPLV